MRLLDAQYPVVLQPVEQWTVLAVAAATTNSHFLIRAQLRSLIWPQGTTQCPQWKLIWTTRIWRVNNTSRYDINLKKNCLSYKNFIFYFILFEIQDPIDHMFSDFLKSLNVEMRRKVQLMTVQFILEMSPELSGNC